MEVAGQTEGEGQPRQGEGEEGGGQVEAVNHGQNHQQPCVTHYHTLSTFFFLHIQLFKSFKTDFSFFSF